jgi:hypothetical protein
MRCSSRTTLTLPAATLARRWRSPRRPLPLPRTPPPRQASPKCLSTRASTISRWAITALLTTHTTSVRPISLYLPSQTPLTTRSDGQAPNPAYQQYGYPVAQRGIYGQPAPGAPPAPIPQATKPNPPSTQSPYGNPGSYPSSVTPFDEQSTYGLGRFGGVGAGVGVGADSKAPSATQPTSQGAQASSYTSQQGQGLHGFLGMNNPSATSASSRPQATTPDEAFKSQGTNSAASQSQGGQQGSVVGVGANQGVGAGARPQQQQQVPQGFGAYGGYGGGYGNQDWSQYGYGTGRNGYSQWQQ